MADLEYTTLGRRTLKEINTSNAEVNGVNNKTKQKQKQNKWIKGS